MSASQVPPLFRLPLELREDILEQAFDFIPATKHQRLSLSNPITRLSSDSSNSVDSYQSLSFPRHLDLFLVDRQLHSECCEILTRQMTLQSGLLGAIAVHDVYGEWLLRRLPRSIRSCVVELKLPKLAFDEEGYWHSRTTVAAKRISGMVRMVITCLPALRDLQLQVWCNFKECYKHVCPEPWCSRVFNLALQRHFEDMFEKRRLDELTIKREDIDAALIFAKDGRQNDHVPDTPSALLKSDWLFLWNDGRWSISKKSVHCLSNDRHV